MLKPLSYAARRMVHPSIISKSFSVAPSMADNAFAPLGHGLELAPGTKVFRNLTYEQIYEHEIADGNTVTSSGAVAIDTGIFTGRSPKDKYIVKRNPSAEHVWWGDVNRAIDSEVFGKLHSKVCPLFMVLRIRGHPKPPPFTSSSN